MDFSVIDSYIDSLIKNSTAEVPIWNVEKSRAGKKSGWDYIDGCMILALLEIYSTTKEKKYLDFADYYEDFRIAQDGKIDGYEREKFNIDDINGGKNLITLYGLTGKEKYKKAASVLYSQMQEHPRTKDGSFWHKKIYPNQVWLDGLYMALPFLMEYEVAFGATSTEGATKADDVGCLKGVMSAQKIEDIYKQFFTVYEKMRDKKTGLYYHAYDSSKSVFWADKQTGLSKHFWLRSLGWYSMALLDTLNKAADKTSENFLRLKNIFIEFIDSILKYQDKSGMWFQVPDLPDRKPNYLETSGSAILSYSILKGVRTGVLPKSYQMAGKKAFEGICEKYLSLENGKMSLSGICLVAGLGPENNTRRDGSFEYYMSEPVVKDDAKGSGPFILAYNEYRLV